MTDAAVSIFFISVGMDKHSVSLFSACVAVFIPSVRLRIVSMADGRGKNDIATDKRKAGTPVDIESLGALRVLGGFGVGEGGS